MRKKFLGLLLLIAFFNTANAGFPIGAGRWLLCPSYIHYSANNYWDNDRVLKDYSYSDAYGTYSGKFSSDYLGLYGGYGISNNVEFIFKVPFVSNTFTEGGRLDQNSSVGDIMVGINYFLNHYDYKKHLSFTGSLIIPMYSAISLPTNRTPNRLDTIKVNNQLGFVVPGIELKLGYCGTNQGAMKGVYWDMDAGVRYYFSSNGPTQLFANATIGVPLDDDFKLSGTIRGVSSNSPISNLVSNSQATLVNRDFDYIRMETALGIRLTRESQLWAGIFTDVSGRNIGKGSGYMLSFVFKL